MQSYKTLQSKATKINSYISIINSLRVIQVGLISEDDYIVSNRAIGTACLTLGR